MKHTYKLVSILFLILILTMSTIVAAAPTTAVISDGDKGDKSIPSPTPPQGYTVEQVKKAIDISIKEQENQTKQMQTSGTVSIASISQNGDGMWIIRPYIDTQYYVYKYYICTPNCYYVYPYLKIPLKTEVWDDNLNPQANAYTYYAIYYWNYYSNTWTFLTSNYKYTDSQGISRLGIMPPQGIPYKYYSDKYYVFEYVYYNGKWQSWTSFFNVGWY